jgi:hypothetical protein
MRPTLTVTGWPSISTLYGSRSSSRRTAVARTPSVVVSRQTAELYESLAAPSAR